jgi:hypothetical protein
MTENEWQFDLQELERIDRQLQQIKKACGELAAFSREKGGVPVIDRNVERISAPLEILMAISEVLDILKYEGAHSSIMPTNLSK